MFLEDNPVLAILDWKVQAKRKRNISLTHVRITCAGLENLPERCSIDSLDFHSVFAFEIVM